MRSPLLAALLTATALSAACTSTPGAQQDPATSSPPATTSSPTTSTPSSTSTDPARSARGLVVKKVGERAMIGNDESDMRASFTLDAIEVDPPCAEGGAPEHGHFIAVAFTVRTTALLDTSRHWFISPQEFQVVGPDGVTESDVSTTAGFGCLPNSEYLPKIPYTPGSTYTGKVVLDSRNPSGVITYRPYFVTPGWEWVFPTT